LAAKTVNGSGNGTRSGAQTLTLLAAPLNCAVLRTLSDGAKEQGDLRRATGSPAQSTLRTQLRKLTETGAIAKHRRNRFPGILEYELTKSGSELLFVATVMESWLENAPEGRLTLGSGPAKAAIKALAEGWSTTMLRALSAGPLALTELDRVIGSLSYPSLERRLGAMRLAGLVESRAGDGRGTPYAVTPWLREGIAPVAAAARWERRHLPRATAPVTRIDAEAVFLLAMPLLQLPPELSGSCRMAFEIPNGKSRRLAGVIVDLRDGKPVSYATQLQGNPDAWALGLPAAWFDALIERDSDRLELGGDGLLVRALLNAMHEALFKERVGLR
jgi:DNA-binding HxlR family transcriptional regulator